MMNDVLEALAKLEGFYAAPGATDEQIAELEAELGVTLPDAYRDLLRRASYFEWFGQVICGISDERECSAAYYTKRERQADLPKGHWALPREGIVIQPYGGGGSYLLFSKESDRAGEIALFADESLGKEVQSWPDLETFLEEKVRFSE